MSGHNKWSSIKHRKGAQDAKRGKIFTKLIKEITISTKFGGSDPNTNPRLRTAISTAKAENMPKENIDRAIKKGAGELEDVSYKEITYEGYGPGGTAVLVESLTDNKKRTVAEIRHIFKKYGGNLGEDGCVSWLFDKKGHISIKIGEANENHLMETALTAGAEDIRNEGDKHKIITTPENFETLKQAIKDANIQYTTSEVTMIPRTTSSLGERDTEKMIKMLTALDENDDVQKVYTNTKI